MVNLVPWPRRPSSQEMRIASRGAACGTTVAKAYSAPAISNEGLPRVKPAVTAYLRGFVTWSVKDRYGSDSDLRPYPSQVCSSPNNRHVTSASACPKGANSGLAWQDALHESEVGWFRQQPDSRHLPNFGVPNRAAASTADRDLIADGRGEEVDTSAHPIVDDGAVEARIAVVKSDPEIRH